MPGLTAPRIDTARLILRPHGLGDFDDLCLLWGDESVVRHIGGIPATPEQAWNRLLRYAGHWALNGYGFWAIEERATGAFVGDVGLFAGRRDIDPSFDAAPEAGWALLPTAHGQGYASEALAAALAWGEDQHGFARTVCMIEPANGASLRVAERIGYVDYSRASYADAEMILMERIVTPRRQSITAL